MKHNYPKTRKPRSTEYALSTKVVSKLGKEKLREIFQHKGMYLAAAEISELYGQKVSAYVARYIRQYKLN